MVMLCFTYYRASVSEVHKRTSAYLIGLDGKFYAYRKDNPSIFYRM